MANLRIFQRKEQKLEQPSNQNHLKPREAMFLPQMILKKVSNAIQFNNILHVIRMSLIGNSYVTRMSSVCHPYVLVCHPDVTCMYSYVIRMSLICTGMSSVCHSNVLV